MTPLFETIYWIIVIIIFYSIAEKYIIKFLDFALRPRKKYHMKARDIWQNQYKKRKKIAAKFLKQLKCDSIQFSGDQYSPPIVYNNIRGIIPDARCFEIFLKNHWFNLAPMWVLVPPELVMGGLHRRRITIRARTVKPQGFQYAPVLIDGDKNREEEMYDKISDYQQNILGKEQIALTEEMKVHVAITGAEVDEISQDLVLREEQISYQTKEPEPDRGI